jgi:hypothetical protein
MDDNNILTNGWGHSTITLVDQFKCETWEEVDNFEKRMLAEGEFSAKDYNEKNLSWKNANGMHCRALKIPAGDFMTGRIHKNPYIDLLAYGKLKVTSFLEDGTREQIALITGFQFFEGKPGRKRVLQAIEDSLWITVDRTEKTTIQEIEDDASFMNIWDYRKAKNLLEACS